MKNRQKIFGFTLIELMIALAIIGILAAIAIPSYMKSVRKSNRTTAQVELMDAAQRLQRCYTAYGSFITSPGNNSCAVFTQLSGAGIISRGAGYYRIDFDVPATTTTYTLRATPILAPQLQDTGCTKMTLSSVGVRGQAPDAGLTCWQQ